MAFAYLPFVLILSVPMIQLGVLPSVCIVFMSLVLALALFACYFFFIPIKNFFKEGLGLLDKAGGHDKAEKALDEQCLYVSCYDEEPQFVTNYIYAKINGFDEYVTLVVPNNFSVYKMPKFKIRVPKDGFELRK